MQSRGNIYTFNILLFESKDPEGNYSYLESIIRNDSNEVMTEIDINDNGVVKVIYKTNYGDFVFNINLLEDFEEYEGNEDGYILMYDHNKKSSYHFAQFIKNKLLEKDDSVKYVIYSKKTDPSYYERLLSFSEIFIPNSVHHSTNGNVVITNTGYNIHDPILELAKNITNYKDLKFQ